MTYNELRIMKHIYKNNKTDESTIALKLDLSIDLVNKSINSLEDNSYINNYKITDKGINAFKINRPKNAIILAAGLGLRMAPAGNDIPKGLIEVRGEVLIERLINQLKESGVNDIIIVTGYQDEKFEYLKDEFDVRLVFSNKFKTTNNAYSLSLVKEYIGNSYILPSDIYLEENLFSDNQILSWYGLVEKESSNSLFSMSSNKRIIQMGKKLNYEMTGVSYINSADSIILKENLDNLSIIEKRESFWEELLEELIEEKKLHSSILDEEFFYEVNSYEDLRGLDAESINLSTSITKLLETTFKIPIDNFYDIEITQTGMTNRSFKFSVKNNTYIMRIPGFGTSKIIDRTAEMVVYEIVSKENISDELIYINDKNGYKITKFIDNSKVCNPFSKKQVVMAMKSLKCFHEKKLKVDHYFDLFDRLEYYEGLRKGKKSEYLDYQIIKDKIISLKAIIDKIDKEIVLTHIDAVSDNFMITGNNVRIIDWEYAAMQDPHLDIAMFAIYSMYDDNQINFLIESYFTTMPDQLTIAKIYSYIAISGLLWSNWCEYKKMMGDDFGQYSIAQYEYASKYYDKAMKLFEEEKFI